MIRVIVAGATGRVGRVMMDGLAHQPDLAVVGGFGSAERAAGARAAGARGRRAGRLHHRPGRARTSCRQRSRAGLHVVSGTSGLPPTALDELDAALQKAGKGGLWAANFAIGGALMMHFARVAARFMDAAEVIELHHDGKVDAPSGTAVQTARDIRAAHGSDLPDPQVERWTLEGSRGAVDGGVRIHSVRLPGFNAHQEVLFGSLGQVLSIRHDALGRDAYLPGVALAVREVPETRWPGARSGYTHGSAMSYAIGVVGATGQVGREFLRILEEGDRPDLPIGSVRLFASERSAGKRITVRGQEHVVERAEPDPRLFDGPGLRAQRHRRRAGQAVLAGHRPRGRAQRRQVERLADGPDRAAGGARGQPRGRPRRTTASSPARTARPPRWWSRCGRSTRSTRSSASSSIPIRPSRARAGAPSTSCRRRQRRTSRAASLPREVYPHQIHLNVIPEIGSYKGDGLYSEERKMIDETRKIFHAPDLRDQRHVRARAGRRRPLRSDPRRARAADAAGRSARDPARRAGHRRRRRSARIGVPHAAERRRAPIRCLSDASARTRRTRAGLPCGWSVII